MDDTAQFKANVATSTAAHAHTLAQTVANATAAGKEPFTFEAFEAEQIKQNKTLERVLSPEAWTEKYYLTYPAIMTMEDFVAEMYEVDPFV